MKAKISDVGWAFLGLVACGLLWQSLAKFEYVLLGAAYSLFALQLASLLGKPSPWKRCFFLAALVCCIGLVGMLLSKKSNLYPLYPLATALAYSVLLQVLWAVVNKWIFSVPHSMRLHFQKRYLFYGLGLLALLFATATMDQSDPYGPHFQLKIMVWVLLVLLVGNWFMGQWRLVKTLESAKTAAELEHLKSQIQPHFLFNTLNNLYGLARENSNQTADMILNLAELLRFGVYHANLDRIPLSKELDYVDRFLALQTLRCANEVAVSRRIDLQEQDPQVSPLLLIPLVENAFKHGVEHLAQGAFLKLSLTLAKGELIFTVENNLNTKMQPQQPGIGLSNLQKRLALVYPNQHHFSFEIHHDLAKAQLRIFL